MKSKQALVILVAVAAMTGLVTSQPTLAAEFLPFEGKNTVREGEGGTKKVIEGIDFWSNGEPPRKYRLLGFVQDTRGKTGLFGMIAMSSLETDVAAAAKGAGGDAVILVGAETETVGAVGNSFGGIRANSAASGNTVRTTGTGWGMGASVAVQKQHSRYAVVKYLAEDVGQVQPDQGSAQVASTPARGE